MTEDTTKLGLSRRTLAKGAAWSVPAVAVAAAAPAMAASALVTVSEAGDACKLPGNSCSNAGYNKGYLQPLTICNNSTVSVTVTITEPATLTFNGNSTVFTPVPASFTVAPGGCQNVTLNLNLQDNSQNSSITGTLNWTAIGGSLSVSGSTAINTASTPPCVDCAPPASGARVAAAQVTDEEAAVDQAAAEQAAADQAAADQAAADQAAAEKEAAAEQAAAEKEAAQAAAQNVVVDQTTESPSPTPES